MFHETITYLDLSWSIVVATSDLKGHRGREANFPHYHLHMTIDDNSFINFGDFHILLTEDDIFYIFARRGKFDKIRFMIPHGESHSDLSSFINTEDILNTLVVTDQPRSNFHLQTIIMANEGETLNGDVLDDLIKESKRTGLPVAVLAKKINAKTSVVIEPSNLIDPVLRKKSRSDR